MASEREAPERLTEMAAAEARQPHPIMRSIWAMERAQRYDLGPLAAGYVADALEASRQALAERDALLAERDALRERVAGMEGAARAVEAFARDLEASLHQWRTTGSLSYFRAPAPSEGGAARLKETGDDDAR